MTPELYYIIIVNILVFVAGYLLGQNNSMRITKVYDDEDSTSQQSEYKKRNKAKSYNRANKKIDIDETKVVTKISTDSLEKKYEELGNIETSDTNISESVNRLKSLKRG
jgi:hypothetical protein